MKVAALYVETGGVYYGLPDVDPWDEERDARLYAGPWPVVAHPPCSRLPRLLWGAVPVGHGHALVSWCGNHTSKFDKRPRVGKAVAAATPIAFRDLLLDMARSKRLT